MNDRGMIKWAPFNSVVNSKRIINELNIEKQKVRMPELSNEDEEKIENDIINAFCTKCNVDITYYENGYLLNIISKIKKIDHIYKMIYLDNKRLLFKQIIKINYF